MPILYKNILEKIVQYRACQCIYLQNVQKYKRPLENSLEHMKAQGVIWL